MITFSNVCEIILKLHELYKPEMKNQWESKPTGPYESWSQADQGQYQVFLNQYLENSFILGMEDKSLKSLKYLVGVRDFVRHQILEDGLYVFDEPNGRSRRFDKPQDYLKDGDLLFPVNWRRYSDQDEPYFKFEPDKAKPEPEPKPKQTEDEPKDPVQ